MSPSLHDFLRHILHECDYILKVTDKISYDAFANDETLRKATVRSLEIIGEAVKKLPGDFRTENSHIAWREIAGMRDFLIHVYFGIDYEIVWDAIQNNIPELRLQLIELISENS